MAKKAEKYLVIVESPAKAKTIGKYLGPAYQVKACMGHLRDLPKSKLGVDIEGGFAPEEAEALCKAGAVQVGLGPRILRCETAPTAVLAAVMALTGNFE